MCGCLSLTPYWGPGPQPRHVPWQVIKPVTLRFAGRRSIHWATPARSQSLFFLFFKTRVLHFIKVMFLNFYLFILEKGMERGKHQFVVPLIYAFIGWFLHVSSMGIKHTTLVYQDNVLTNWTTRSGLINIIRPPITPADFNTQSVSRTKI